MMNNEQAAWEIHHGEALQWLRGLSDNSVDAVITDPPYSSGGFSDVDKAKPPAEKYQSGGTLRQYPPFRGDNLDQRSYMSWCFLWIEECCRILKKGGYFLAFTDWRQLPVTTDSVQIGGIFWRGIVVWDKGAGARAPHKGYFRHQCEYVVWGTKGGVCASHPEGPFSGCIKEVVLQRDKHHLTGKPTALMRELVRCCPRGGLIVDPFCGSGSTGVAALLENRRFMGCEREAAYVSIARQRLQSTADPLADMAPRQAALV